MTPKIRARAHKSALTFTFALLLSTGLVAAAYNTTNWYVGNRAGVGTDVPAHRLGVIGGPQWTKGGAWLGSIELGNAGAIGWRTNPAGMRFGMGHNASGFSMFRTASNLGTTSNSPAYDLFINNRGLVGLGTTTPAHRLSVGSGPAWTSSFWSGAVDLPNASAIGWRANGAGQRFGMGHTNGGFHLFRTPSDPGTTAGVASYDLTISDSGHVGVRNTAPAYPLHVSGSTWIENGNLYVTGGAIYLGGQQMNVPDYVFEPGYPLRSLSELRAYLAENKHLPNVPSATEIGSGALDVTGFQMRLLEKIEELTLYTLAQDEQIQALQRETKIIQQTLSSLLNPESGSIGKPVQGFGRPGAIADQAPMLAEGRE